MTSRPSEAQRRVLLRLASGMDAFGHLKKTASPQRGDAGTIRAMTRRGWLVWHDGAWRLTERGRELAREIGGGQ